MGNVLEFFVRMKDMMSGGLVRMASTARNSFASVERNIRNVTRGNDTLSSSFNELKKRISEVESRIQTSTSLTHLRAARRELSLLQRQASNHAGNLDRGSSSGGGLFASLAPAALLAGALALGGSALGQSAKAEGQQISFKVLTGSQKEGSKLYNDIVKMADTTPYESQDLSRSGKTLLGYGVNKKDIIPDLKMLGDVAAAADSPAESLHSLALAFGQVTAKGHLAGQETLQMVNAGFNPLKEISDMTGISVDKLTKAQEKGAISASMVQKAFAHATGEGGRYHNMMIEQSNTLSGRWSTFMDLAHHKLRDFGDAMQPAAKGLLEFGSGLLNAEPAAIAMATALGIMTVALTYQSIAAKAATVYQWALNVAMDANPIGLIIAGIAALAAGLIYAYQKVGWFRGAILASWEAIKGFGNLMKEYVVDRIQGLLAGIGGMGKAIGQLFSGNFKAAWETSKQAVSDIVGVDAGKNALTNAKKIGENMGKAYHEGVAQVAANGKVTTKSTTLSPSKIDGLTGKEIAGLKGKGSSGKDGEESVKGITSGGAKTININGMKFIETFNLHSQTVSEGIENVEQRLMEMYMRLLQSGAKI